MQLKLPLVLVSLLILSAGRTGKAADDLLETKYYRVDTRLTREQAKEVYVRMDAFYEQLEDDFAFLKRKDEDVAGRAKEKFKGVLCRDNASYRATGAPAWSAGFYSGKDQTLYVDFAAVSELGWTTVIHEAAHQYFHLRVGGKWPSWFNEGLATYYEYALFGGDSYLPGYVSKRYVQMNREIVSKRQLIPFERLWTSNPEDWARARMLREGYHQSWTYVHYMLHSDSRNQRAFQRFIQGLVNDEKPEEAWRAAVPDQREFLQGWNKFWGQASVENEQEWRQRQAVLLIAAGIARVNASHGKQVQDLAAYFRACQSKQIRLKETPETWLPLDMLLHAAVERDQTGRWTLAYNRDGLPTLTVQRRDGPGLEVRYRAIGDRHRSSLVVLDAAK